MKNEAKWRALNWSPLGASESGNIQPPPRDDEHWRHLFHTSWLRGQAAQEAA